MVANVIELPGPRGRILVLAGIGLAMLLPVLPERLSGAVPWDPGDFGFLLVLMLVTAGAVELAARTPERLAYRVGVGLALATGLFLAWVNVAVGIIGSEDNPANLIFAGVLGVGIVGALIARGRPLAMAGAMLAVAAAQALAFFVALAAGWGFTGPISVGFVVLWLASALLFRRAAGTA